MTDLIIIGGGFTGVAAAVAAAKHGAKVTLFEQTGALGGAAYINLINPFMPNGTKLGPDKAYTELTQGFYAEFCRRMNEEFSAMSKKTFHEEYMKILLDRMTKEAGVKVVFHSTLAAVEKDGDAVRAVQVVQKNGLNRYEAKYFLDATGDGMLSALAGVPMRLGRPEDNLCQPMTLCFRMGNIDIEKFNQNRPLMQELYKKFQAEGKIKNPRENVLVFPTMVDGMLHFNTTRIIRKNPVDPDDLSWAEMEAREQMLEMFTFLRENVPGCEKAQLVTSNDIGVRESRMIDGQYVLTEEDLKACKRFDDCIACGNYDIDIHNPAGTGTSHYYFPEGQYYDIPLRTLRPVNVENLLVGGRCISVTHEAQASIRIMPICCSTGEAAGVAAAVANKHGVKLDEADVQEIRATLKADGAFIGA